MKKSTFVLFLILFSTSVIKTPALAQQEKYSWGGDMRARVANFDRIPREDGRAWPENRYFRFRSRVWGQYDFTPDISFRARLVNEWRKYETGKGVNRYELMDEFVFDNLFIEIKNLLRDRFDIRIGRQDMMFGTGRIIRLGTPLDSSRTFYFNAVKGSFEFDKLTVDLFGIYNKKEDELALHSEDRALTEGDEKGGGIYITNRRFKDIPQEYYYVYKKEERALDLDLHTFGVRFSPDLPGGVSANFEIAVQDGRRENTGDISGELFDLSLYYKLPVLPSRKPVVDLSYYYLSGDDPSSAGEEGWHTVWARYPQYMSYIIVRSLVSGSQNFASWTNISMPSVGLKLDVHDKMNMKLRLAGVYAPKKGPGGGKHKGTLIICRLTYKLKKHWDGNLHVEVMSTGSYFAPIKGNAHYAHFDLMYHF